MTQENLSPGAEKERSVLADKFRKLKIQLGCENDPPDGRKVPPRPPKGGIAIPGLKANEAQDGEELYDDVAGNLIAWLFKPGISLFVRYADSVMIFYCVSDLVRFPVKWSNG